MTQDQAHSAGALSQVGRSIRAMVSGKPLLVVLPPRLVPALSPRISRLGILTGGVLSQGIARLAAFFVAYFGAVPSLVNALIHSYDRPVTSEEISVAGFWLVLLLVSLAVVVVMNRFARYMHQWWLGEVAARVAANYDIPWPMVAKATRYKPLATPYWPSRNRVLRLHDKQGWLSGESKIEILVPARPDRPMIVALRKDPRDAVRS